MDIAARAPNLGTGCRFLNGAIADLAVRELLVMVLVYRNLNKDLHYKSERGIEVSVFSTKPGSFVCNYLLGMGKKINVYQYIQQ